MEWKAKMSFTVAPPGMDNSGFHKANHNFTEMLGESCLAVMCNMSEQMHKFFIQNSKTNFLYYDIYSVYEGKKIQICKIQTGYFISD